MSLPSPTGLRALDVPSTPTSPLEAASLGRAPQVLTQAPLGTEKKPRTQLVLVASDTHSMGIAPQYYAQIHGWPASSIVQVSSWDDVKRELSACSSIGELVLFTHSVYDALEVNGTQLTANQFLAEFEKIAPPIGSLTFDGCVFGTNLEGLHAIATGMKIPQVRGWTYWHCISPWNFFPTGSIADALAEFQPLADRASPWLPKSADGLSVYSRAEQEALFIKSKMNLAGEYFVYLFSDQLKDMRQALTDGSMVPDKHRTRGSADVRLVDSAGAQGALDMEIRSSRPPFFRVVMTPW